MATEFERAGVWNFNEWRICYFEQATLKNYKHQLDSSFSGQLCDGHCGGRPTAVFSDPNLAQANKKIQNLASP